MELTLLDIAESLDSSVVSPSIVDADVEIAEVEAEVDDDADETILVGTPVLLDEDEMIGAPKLDDILADDELDMDDSDVVELLIVEVLPSGFVVDSGDALEEIIELAEMETDESLHNDVGSPLEVTDPVLELLQPGPEATDEEDSDADTVELEDCKLEEAESVVDELHTKDCVDNELDGSVVELVDWSLEGARLVVEELQTEDVPVDEGVFSDVELDDDTDEDHSEDDDALAMEAEVSDHTDELEPDPIVDSLRLLEDAGSPEEV
jgi:hypothetical protein